MVDHGRLIKVILALMTAMTAGALLLLGLEGKPIKPMAYSLSSQVNLPPVQQVLGTQHGIQPKYWQRIEIVAYEGPGLLTAEGLNGPYAGQFHFVIGNGKYGKDGEIYASTPWTKQQPCFLSRGAANPRTIRICLMGNAKNQGTPRQSNQLESLVKSLNRNCQSDLQITWR